MGRGLLTGHTHIRTYTHGREKGTKGVVGGMTTRGPVASPDSKYRIHQHNMVQNNYFYMDEHVKMQLSYTSLRCV